MKKEHIVFSQRLAATLMLQGFVLKKMGKSDKPNSNKNIFFFNESEDLLKAIERFKNNNK